MILYNSVNGDGPIVECRLGVTALVLRSRQESVSGLQKVAGGKQKG